MINTDGWQAPGRPSDCNPVNPQRGQHTMNSIKTDTTAFRILLPVLLYVALMTTTLISVSNRGQEMTARIGPQIDASIHIKYELTRFHLWFEELVSGDPTITKERVWHHLDEAYVQTRSLLNGGMSHDRVVIPTKDPVLKGYLANTEKLISLLADVAKQRLNAPRTSRPGSSLDTKLDNIFDSALHQADLVEARLTQEIQGELQTYRILSWGTYALAILSAIVFGAWLFNLYGKWANATQSLNQFKDTLDKTLDCVFMFDAETFRFFYANAGACAQVGYTARELASMTPADITPGFDTARLRGMAKALQASDIHHTNYETLHEHKDGHLIPVSIFLQYIDLPNERPRFVAVVHDITERKKTEMQLKEYSENLEVLVAQRTRSLEETQEQLLRKERLATLGQLTATVSHEIRNPLGAIMSGMFTIRRHADPGDKKYLQTIERIERNVYRCDRIIDEMLDFTRVSHVDLSEQPLDDWLLSVLNEQELPDGIELVTELSLSGKTALIDSHNMRRALINVVDNACQAMLEGTDRSRVTEGARLTISTKVSNGRIKIHVRDTGCGIPNDVLDKIFEPLFSTKGFGVGLGMPIVRNIMEQHRGGILIDSTPGEGTTVTLWLPE